VKRLLVVFFSFSILSSSGGLVMAQHFCAGELIESTFSKELHSCCEGTEAPVGCCDMEHQLVQHDDNTLISSQTIDPPSQILLHTVEYPSHIASIIHNNFVRNNYLLRTLTVPDLVIRHQSFLI